MPTETSLIACAVTSLVAALHTTVPCVILCHNMLCYGTNPLATWCCTALCNISQVGATTADALLSILNNCQVLVGRPLLPRKEEPWRAPPKMALSDV